MVRSLEANSFEMQGTTRLVNSASSSFAPICTGSGTRSNRRLPVQWLLLSATEACVSWHISAGLPHSVQPGLIFADRTAGSISTPLSAEVCWADGSAGASANHVL